jgi:hypothetical protein
MREPDIKKLNFNNITKSQAAFVLLPASGDLSVHQSIYKISPFHLHFNFWQPEKKNNIKMWKALYDDADRSEKLLFLANLRNETQDKSGGKKKFNVPRTVSSAFRLRLDWVSLIKCCAGHNLISVSKARSQLLTLSITPYGSTIAQFKLCPVAFSVVIHRSMIQLCTFWLASFASTAIKEVYADKCDDPNLFMIQITSQWEQCGFPPLIGLLPLLARGSQEFFPFGI